MDVNMLDYLTTTTQLANRPEPVLKHALNRPQINSFEKRIAPSGDFFRICPKSAFVVGAGAANFGFRNRT